MEFLEDSERNGNYEGYNYWVWANRELGFRCGYVEVPEGHPYYGMEYIDVPISCHGGLTYSNLDNGRYIIGFDCGHIYDKQDVSILNNSRIISTMTEGILWTCDMVEDECKDIIDQLVRDSNENRLI